MLLARHDATCLMPHTPLLRADAARRYYAVDADYATMLPPCFFAMLFVADAERFRRLLLPLFFFFFLFSLPRCHAAFDATAMLLLPAAADVTIFAFSMPSMSYAAVMLCCHAAAISRQIITLPAAADAGATPLFIFMTHIMLYRITPLPLLIFAAMFMLMPQRVAHAARRHTSFRQDALRRYAITLRCAMPPPPRRGCAMMLDIIDITKIRCRRDAPRCFCRYGTPVVTMLPPCYAYVCARRRMRVNTIRCLADADGECHVPPSLFFS